MPDSDGFEVLKWARRQKALEHMPMVVHSSSNDARDRARAEKLGATAYLVKLPTVSEVRRVLGQFCALPQEARHA